jgi:hypothetical protein
MNLPLERIEAAAQSKKSSLYYVLVENYDNLLPIFSAAVRPNYPELAKLFGELGFRDNLGNPPTDRTLNHTWKQVKSLMYWRNKKRTKQVSPAVTVVEHTAGQVVDPGDMDSIRAMLRGNK